MWHPCHYGVLIVLLHLWACISWAKSISPNGQAGAEAAVPTQSWYLCRPCGYYMESFSQAYLPAYYSMNLHLSQFAIHRAKPRMNQTPINVFSLSVEYKGNPGKQWQWVIRPHSKHEFKHANLSNQHSMELWLNISEFYTDHTLILRFVFLGARVPLVCDVNSKFSSILILLLHIRRRWTVK